MKITIGLSYAPLDRQKYNKYAVALQKAAEHLEHELTVINLSSSPKKIGTVDGILFTGGADVAPERYNKPELRDVCEVDEKRDELEFSLAAKADERKLPILGICRGLQLLNVHYGGTLIADMPSAGLPSHSKINDNDITNGVHIEPGSLLKRITGQIESDVASAHHQAIDDVAPGMSVSARATDDPRIIEAIEWKDQDKKPYFLAVQWHPERMDLDRPLSAPLFENFIENVAMAKLLAPRMKENDNARNS